MAHAYTLSTFLRQTPNALLAEYFTRRGLLGSVDLSSLGKTETKPIMTAVEELDPDMRASVEADFQPVFSLATKSGTRVIVDQAALHGLFIADEIEAMENHYYRALWLWLEHGAPSTLFDDCVTVARFDHLSFSASRRRKDLPKQVPGCGDAVLEKMAAAISAVYKPQGRGYRCKVDHYLRADPTRHCFYAYPEDFTTSELQFEGQSLARRTRKSVFEVAFVFRPDEGVLEISAPGKKKDIQTLQEVFCRCALGMGRLPPLNNSRCYELNGLKKRSFAFPTDPQDKIARVEVVALRLRVNGLPRQRVLIESDPTSDLSLYDWMDRVVDQQSVPLSMLDVAQARIRVEWEPENGSKPKTATFTLGVPDSCTLKDEPHHLVVKRYLKAWTIAA
jgi:hypothetical protein